MRAALRPFGLLLALATAGIDAYAAPAEDTAVDDTAPDDTAPDDTAPDDTAPDDTARPTAACPALFGDEAQRQDNAAFREARLHSLHRSDHILELVHAVPVWRAPATRALPGLTLLGADADRARVQVETRWQALCPPGIYTLRVDDALGAGGAILAILDELLLVALEDGLAFVQRKGGRAAPPVRMIWRSGFGLQTAGGGGGGGGASASASAVKDSPAPGSRSERLKRARDARKTLARPAVSTLPRGGKK